MYNAARAALFQACKGEGVSQPSNFQLVSFGRWNFQLNPPIIDVTIRMLTKSSSHSSPLPTPPLPASSLPLLTHPAHFPDVLPRPPLLILIHLLLLLLPLRSLHPVYPLLSSLLFSTFFRWKRSASSQIRLRRYPSHSSVVHSTPILFPRVVGNSPERERLADSVNIGPAVAHARGWRARVVVRPNDSFWQVKWTTNVILETSPVPCT